VVTITAEDGYAILGRVIEVRSGQPYEHFVSDGILRPLDVRDGEIHPPAIQLPGAQL
jgi:CubicO group peptidase (beta-lactamase class C family)